MYTRTESPTHIIQEVIDNSADEALAGFAHSLKVVMHEDGSISVEDDGRGIPVGMHPEEKVPTVQLIFTQLHSGGKFKKGGIYAFSGGLHGVGVSVTNALSKRLAVTVMREGTKWQMAFADGEVADQLKKVGACPRTTTGTRIRVWPDPKYFDSPTVSVPELERLLRSKAVLLPGVRVSLTLVSGEVREWAYPNGLADYLLEMIGDGEPVAPMFAGERYVVAIDGEAFSPGEGAAWALAWCDQENKGESFVNLIPTPTGGTHVAGLRAGVFDAVQAFITHHGLLPKGVKLQPEDVWSKTSYIVSAKVLDPQFQGQTKEQLTSRDALKLVASRIKDPLELWLNSNPEAGKAIADLAIKHAQARANNGVQIKKRTNGTVVLLPDKLKDCQSTDISRNELILVEGDSAGGSAVQGRDKDTQAILFLRGKGLNAWEVPLSKVLDNSEIQDISTALGVEPHTTVADADLSKLRYGRIIIMTDADVDGSHIQTLLLTLKLRHFPALLYGGYVYIAQPPLYRLDVPAHGKKRPERKIYVLDEAEKEAGLLRLEGEGIPRDKVAIGRFKGLGEMLPIELWESSLCPDTRRLIQMRIDAESTDAAMATFDMLMRKTRSADRRAWLERRGNEVEISV
jgi:topoisomerase-4 subunit B